MHHKIHELTKRLQEIEMLLQQEIKKRKAAEEALNKNKEILKSVLKEMPVIIFAIDDDGSLVFYNREFEKVSGYSASEIGDNLEVLELLIPNDTSALAPEAESQGEWKFQDKNGMEKVIAWSNISGYFPILGWKSWKVGVDITELKSTLARVKTLSGLLPICANCKKIRDDKGYWNRLEAYIQDHSEAEFTHGICPECAKTLYPELSPREK